MNADKLIRLMEIIDEHKETLGDGTYLDACNILKHLNASRDEEKHFEDEVEEALYGLGARQIRGGIPTLHDRELEDHNLYRVQITALEPIVVIKHDEYCTPKCRRHKPTIIHQPYLLNTYMSGGDLKRADLHFRLRGVFDSSKAFSLQDNLNAVLRNDAPYAKIKEKSYIITDIQFDDNNNL